MARRRSAKPKQHEKRVNFIVIAADTKEGKPLYSLMSRLIEKFHEELTNARIVLAWALNWKADADGITKLGQCRKVSDLDRELHGNDFVILLNREYVQSPTTTDEQRAALIDHELCHATVHYDREGEPKRNEKGRVLYRTRKHEIEEFAEIIQRYGLYKRTLEAGFAALQRRQADLQLDGVKPSPSPTVPTPPATAH